MESLAEERMPGIVHFPDFEFGGIVFQPSFMPSEVIRESATG
jgi:hypothetical protein